MSNTSPSKDSLNPLSTLSAGGKTYHYYSLPKAADTLGDLSRLPFSLKVLMENLLRNEDGTTVDRSHIDAMVQWLKDRGSDTEIQFRPARVMAGPAIEWNSCVATNTHAPPILKSRLEEHPYMRS